MYMWTFLFVTLRTRSKKQKNSFPKASPRRTPRQEHNTKKSSQNHCPNQRSDPNLLTSSPQASIPAQPTCHPRTSS